MISASAAPTSGAQVKYQDDGTRVVPVDMFIEATIENPVHGVYGVMDDERELVFVSMSKNVAASLEALLDQYDYQDIDLVKVMTFAIPSVRDMRLVLESWIQDNGEIPVGNLEKWVEIDDEMQSVVSIVVEQIQNGPREIISPFETNSVQGDADESEMLDLTDENVELVLNDVRPYLIADGGNISVVTLDQENAKLTLQLEGACGSCSSSATTMKLGVEKALHAKFGSNLTEVVAISAPDTSSGDVSIEACEKVLDEVRDALRGLGSDVTVSEVDEDEVILEYTGPNNLKYGLELLIKQRLPVITTVTFEAPER